MKSYQSIGIQKPDIYLPAQNVDPTLWAVIACDQFTSQPEYWNEVEKMVGDAPSTLHMILPEVYLNGPDEEQRVKTTQQTMRRYLDEGVLTPFEGFVLVERKLNGHTRYGLMMALDLERYDFTAGSQSLIRATEGTILDRLPPRMRIREGAPIELPHILVLVDDPKRTVIEPLLEYRSRLQKLYDFDLMQGSGHLTGYAITDPAMESDIVHALEGLTNPETFAQKYKAGADKDILLFAVGDGNHSLATAKSIWEKIKGQVGMNHPARYALVEIENLHEQALVFEPIHRVLFGVKSSVLDAMKTEFGDALTVEKVANFEELNQKVTAQSQAGQSIGMVEGQNYYLLTVSKPTHNLAVGTLQKFLDTWLKTGAAESIDYVHGADVVNDLGQKPGHVGFLVPSMEKSDLFKTVILDGVLPRKTFSMGEAWEKRFYMECRKIS